MKALMKYVNCFIYDSTGTDTDTPKLHRIQTDRQTEGHNNSCFRRERRRVGRIN